MTIPDDLLESLCSADHIVALTGAGASAESGVPTFRDAQTGLWAKYDPADLATPEAFERDPELVSRWYDERRCSVANCVPNAGHVALAALQRHTLASGRRFTLITQNVDRLHQAAGSADVIELHGTLWVWRRLDCGIEAEERGPAFEVHPLRCPCGGKRRPGVVWFGEGLPNHEWLHAQRAASSCDLFMSLGTSSVVYPAAGLINMAMQNGGRLLEVNPQETPYSRGAHWSIRGKSGEVLPEFVTAALYTGT
jgi:NAD-dependent deacetylase